MKIDVLLKYWLCPNFSVWKIIWSFTWPALKIAVDCNTMQMTFDVLCLQKSKCLEKCLSKVKGAGPFIPAVLALVCVMRSPGPKVVQFCYILPHPCKKVPSWKRVEQAWFRTWYIDQGKRMLIGSRIWVKHSFTLLCNTTMLFLNSTAYRSKKPWQFTPSFRKARQNGSFLLCLPSKACFPSFVSSSIKKYLFFSLSRSAESGRLGAWWCHDVPKTILLC